jgi:hypothetical protein
MRTHLRAISPLIVTLFVALGSCYYYFDLLLPGAHLREVAKGMAGGYSSGGDFYPIWLTGRELFLRGRNPYTQEMTRSIQVGLYGRPMDPRRPADPPIKFRAFSYPLYVDLLAAPLLPLEFNEVRVLLGVLLPVFTAASLALWLRAFHLQISATALAVAVVLLLVSYPVLEGLFLQQAGLLVGVALAMSLAAIARDRLLLGGMLLAFASVKPQLVWLLALWLLLWAVSDWKRRKRFALSFLVTMGFLLLVSEVILSGWWAGWWSSMAGYSQYTLPPLAQLVLGRFVGTLAEVVMVALACAIGWVTRRQMASSVNFLLVVSFLLDVTVIVAPTGNAVFDQVILVPAILWLGFHRAEILNGSRAVRVVALTAMVALCWQWVVACGVALVSLFSPVWAASPAVLVFPTRMAAPLPLLLLALLSFFVVRVLRGRGDRYGVPVRASERDDFSGS